VAKAAAELKVIMSDTLDRIAANAAAGVRGKPEAEASGLTVEKESRVRTNPIEAIRPRASLSVTWVEIHTNEATMINLCVISKLSAILGLIPGC